MKLITSDLHFYHKNIIKYCPKRLEKIQEYAKQHNIELTEENTVDTMNKWLIDMWNSQVWRHDDDVYVLGDFSFGNAEETKAILNQLNGRIHLIVGNHDFKINAMLETGRLESVCQIKTVEVKDLFFSGELSETFTFELCHYPMMTWKQKEYGSIHLHGHCHGNIDKVNEFLNENRVDVGIDGSLADYKLLTFRDIMDYFQSRKAISVGSVSIENIINKIKIDIKE